MAVIKCKMCGGDMEISADKTFGTCEYCGSTMTLPKVSDDQRAAAFNRGNHFRRAGEFDKALGVYERIVADDDTDAEAHWCCALCRFGIEYVEDPATYEWMPTCHRASFDSFLEDVDYLAALEHSDGITRRQYQKDAAKIAEVQRGILATSQNTEPYDVFISYKELDENGERTRDSVLAQDIYYQLTEQGRRVFFSRISLEDIPGTQYEPYIFAALNSAKVMIVVGTSAENLNAVWVKNEWSRFLAMMRKDKTKLLIPCYRDMDPYDMPEQLTVLMSYDMGKIGFIQDLIRGVNKVLDADKPKEKETVHETVVVKSEGGANEQALLKRGNMALEDGDWKRADEFFEQVLNQNAECAEAYLGKFLAENKCRSTDEYADKRIEALRSCGTEKLTACAAQDERILKTKHENALPGYLEEAKIERLFVFDRDYISHKKARCEQLQSEKDFFAQNREIKRIEKYASPEVSERLNGMKNRVFSFLRNAIAEAENEDKANAARVTSEYNAHLEKAEAKAKSLRADAENKREADYEAVVEMRRKATNAGEYSAAAKMFDVFGSYKDCKEQAEQCRAITEQKREQTKKKRIKITAITGAAAVLIIAAVLIVTKVIIPANQYKAAEELYAAGEYREAAAQYIMARNYKDSAEKCISAEQKAGMFDTISAGGYHTVGLKADGTVVAYGPGVVVYLNDEPIVMGDIDSGKCDVSNWTNIVAISAGVEHTVGLKADGTVVATEYTGIWTYSGQRDVSNWTDIIAVSAGACHTVGLKADGTVVAVGDNDSGQCDVSNWTNIVAISAGSEHTVGLKADGTVVAVGRNGSGQCDVSGWEDIVAVSAGGSCTVGLKADGTVVATEYTGSWTYSGLGDWTDIRVPER